MKKLEQDILKFVGTAIKRRGQPPTVREIAKKFDIAVSTAHYHIKKLKLSKHLLFRYGRNKRVARGLKIRTNVRKHGGFVND